MIYRKLGKTGIRISEIGFGAWGIGGGWGIKDDEEAVRAMHRAFELGVNFFDTALGYGGGHSETLIGKTFKGSRQDRRILGVYELGSPDHFFLAGVRFL